MSEEHVIHTILDAFTRAEILCSIGFGPDGDVDTVGMPYQFLAVPDANEFAAELVNAAGDNESVVVELRGWPEVTDGIMRGYYTMRNQLAQARVPN